MLLQPSRYVETSYRLPLHCTICLLHYMAIMDSWLILLQRDTPLSLSLSSIDSLKSSFYEPSSHPSPSPMESAPRKRIPISKVASTRTRKRRHVSEAMITPLQTPSPSPSPRHAQCVHTPHRLPFIPTPSPGPTPFPAAPASQDDSELLDRIHSGIQYTHEQRRARNPVAQTTRFQISTTEASSRTALSLLRRHATLIAAAPGFELFELGIPRPDWVREGDFLGLHDPQWWVGRTAAEIKAGPLADEQDVRRARAYLKGQETKRGRRKGLTGREKEIGWKLVEGLRGAGGGVPVGG